MPKFKENTSSAMKRSAYKMKGYSYPGMSPIEQKKEVKSKVELDDISLENKKKGFKRYLITYNDGSTEKVLQKT